MTSGSENLDVLIKEYLIFKGYIQSAKLFDAELKGGRDKGFRVIMSDFQAIIGNLFIIFQK